MLPLPPINQYLRKMKYLRTFLLVAMAWMACSAFTMKSKEKPVYVFGIAASFNDTIVYYTEIQQLDSVYLDKDGFLPDRAVYSYQLKNHLEYTLGKTNYTCMIYFSENKGKLGKEADKLKNRYRKNEGMALQAVDPTVFTFKRPKD